MNEESEKLYLQNIEEYIFYEDKIVTYKWLSKRLDIHVNVAKQLLYTFATENPAHKKGEIQLTYLVGGLLYDGKGCKFQVVREEDLEKVKSQFKVVTSEHIYSIHKSKQLPDLNLLYAVDSIKEPDDGNVGISGSIQCKNSVRRLEEQLAELRLQARAAAVCADEKQWPSTKNASNKPNSEGAGPSKEAKRPKPPVGIAAMFSAMNNQKGVKKVECSEQKNKNSEEPPINTEKLKTSMFAPVNSKPKNVENVPDKPKKTSEEPKDAGLVEAHVDAKQTKNTMEKSNVKRKTKSQVKSNRQSAVEKRKTLVNISNTEDEMQPIKKRKRILTIASSDSSEDDMFGIEEEEDEEEQARSFPQIEESVQDNDVEDVVPCTPQEIAKRHKRKRKLVDSVTVDKDDYVCTVKEYVHVSCSDSEVETEKENDVCEKNSKSEEIPTPVESKKTTEKAGTKSSSKKKCSPPPRFKQMTLNSYF